MNLQETHDLVNDLWKFIKKYGGSFPIDWEKAVRESADLHGKHAQSSHAAHEMILDAIEILREEGRKHV